MLTAHKIILRYRTLDSCFRVSPKWTLQMLIDKCSKVLNERISKRSIQSDIQFLRDHNAPIVVIQKKFYTYSHGNFNFEKSGIYEKFEQQFLESLNFAHELKKYFPQYKQQQQQLKNSIDSGKEKNINYVKLISNELSQKGFSLLDSFYSNSELKKIEKFQDKAKADDKLLEILLNSKLKKILKKINTRAFLVDIQWKKRQDFEFQQELKLPFKERQIPKNLTLWGYPSSDDNYEKIDKKELYSKTFAIQLFLKNTDSKKGAPTMILGSHKRELTPLEISLITNNTHHEICTVKKGGIILYHPLLIKQIVPFQDLKESPTITLWFSSYELPIHYIWNKKIKI